MIAIPEGLVDATHEALAEFFGLDLSACHGRVEIPRVGRADLARFFAAAGFNKGVEIGVLNGDYSAELCRANPALELWSIDPYTFREDYHSWGERTQEDCDAAYVAASAALAPFNCHLWREFSLTAVQTFEDHSLDFVYLDGHHNFQNVTNDICAWSRKLRHGGLCCGHDYFETARPGFGLHVKYVVDAFTKSYGIDPWFVLGEKRAPAGERDDHRSFLWVNRPMGLERGR